ncbi:MAG: DUF1365 domain-containing protein [bacterium]
MVADFQSCLYECEVMHHRLKPKKHRFRYRIFLFYLDLDEVDSLARKRRLFARNRFNLYSFRDQDHLDPDNRPLKEKILSYLAARGVDLKNGKIFLLTHLRTFGYLFNPVSFYFCFDEKNEPVCVVPEVGNTFGEMKTFFLGGKEKQEDGVFHQVTPKHFYVSPFMDLNVDFEFILKAPGESLALQIHDSVKGERILLTTLTGKRRPLSDGRLLSFTFKYPLMTLQVIARIHWNALLLYWKKIPFFRKTENPELQREVLRPYIAHAEEPHDASRKISG